MASVAPNTQVTAVPIDVADAWDFEQVYGALHDIARNYAFDVERNQYFINITTGFPCGTNLFVFINRSALPAG